MNPLQKQTEEFMQKMGWQYWTPEKVIAKMREELREFEAEIASGNAEKAKGEFGDIIFALTCYANSKNISMDDSLKQSIDKYSVRDKNRDTNNEGIKPIA